MANCITAIRFVAVFAAVYCITTEHLFVALLVMSAAELSDLLDGWVARNFGKVTKLGKVMDPIADSVYHLSMFATFVSLGWMKWPFLMVFAIREIISYVYRPIMWLTGGELGARNSGKAKAVSQGICQLVIVLMQLLQWRVGDDLALMALLTAFYFAVQSGIEYGQCAWRALKTCKRIKDWRRKLKVLDLKLTRATEEKMSV